MANTTIKNISTEKSWTVDGQPSVDVLIETESGAVGYATVPALADQLPIPVDAVVRAIKIEISEVLSGQDSRNQKKLDDLLVSLDGTSDLRRLGGNTLYAASLAVARAAARAHGNPLVDHLRTGDAPLHYPMPRFGISRRSSEPPSGISLVPAGAASFADALSLVLTISRNLEVAGAGSVAERIAALDDLIKQSAPKIAIALDIAARRDPSTGSYIWQEQSLSRSSDEQCAHLIDLVERHAIVSLTDPFDPADHDGMTKIAWALGDNAEVALLGFHGHAPNAVRELATKGFANTVMVSPCAAGSLSRAKATIDAARQAGLGCILAAPSADGPNPASLALATAWGCPQVLLPPVLQADTFAMINEAHKWPRTLGHPHLSDAWIGPDDVKWR